MGYNFLSKICRMLKPLSRNRAPGPTTIILQGLRAMLIFVYHIGWGCQFAQAVHSFIRQFMNIAYNIATKTEHSTKTGWLYTGIILAVSLLKCSSIPLYTPQT